MSKPTINEAKRKLSRELMQDPRVSGVGIDTGEDGEEQIKVYLADDDSDLALTVPPDVEGYPVAVEVLGPITPRTDCAG